MMYKDVDFKINARIRKCLLHTSCHNILLFGTQEACEGRKTKKNITEEREGTDKKLGCGAFSSEGRDGGEHTPETSLINVPLGFGGGRQV